MSVYDPSKRVSLWGEIENGMPNSETDTHDEQHPEPDKSGAPFFADAATLHELRLRSGSGQK